MNKIPYQRFTDRQIIEARGPKNVVDPSKPYGWMIEKERTAAGEIEETAVIFLTNSECPFRCLMCDLWKNTTDRPVPKGSVPEQIEWALNQLPRVKHLKLYNSGSFFDRRAIDPIEHRKIASLVNGFDTLIIESHPKLINESCLKFRDILKADLHIALGLETVNPEVLASLNKKMTAEEFSQSVKFLKKNGITSRAFILLRPPFMSEEEGIFWAERSIDFAFASGVECCTVIPVRDGNGAMEALAKEGLFTIPEIQSLETVTEYGVGLKAGRVFADVWDLNRFSRCPECLDERIIRLTRMNLSQEIPEPVVCSCNS